MRGRVGHVLASLRFRLSGGGGDPTVVALSWSAGLPFLWFLPYSAFSHRPGTPRSRDTLACPFSSVLPPAPLTDKRHTPSTNSPSLPQTLRAVLYGPTSLHLLPPPFYRCRFLHHRLGGAVDPSKVTYQGVYGLCKPRVRHHSSAFPFSPSRLAALSSREHAVSLRREEFPPVFFFPSPAICLPSPG